jgi:hypothetical protein
VARGLLGSYRSKGRRDDMAAARQRGICAAVRLGDALASGGGRRAAVKVAWILENKIAEPDIPSYGSRKTWSNVQEGTHKRTALLLNT